MEQRPTQRKGNPKPNSSGIMLLSAVILGASVIIAGVSIGGSVNKLTTAVKEQTFYMPSPASPSTLTVNNSADKKYFTADEAAAYLNVTVDEIKAAVTKGEIKQYIKTSGGYSISQESLDKYFSDKAYELENQNNAEES